METTAPKPFVFVLMPFASEFDDVYKLGIKPACAEAGAFCQRVDEQHYDENMLERIYNQIAKADLLVADMTGQNPNVFYEVGYAHALGKKVILLTQKTEHIPFDLKHRPFIVYGSSISKLKNDLESRVRWFLESPEKSSVSVSSGIEVSASAFSIKRELFTGNGERMLPVTGFEIIIYNKSQKIVQPGEFNLGIILPKEWADFSFRAGPHPYETYPTNAIDQSDGTFLLMLPSRSTPFFPQEWSKSHVEGQGKNEVDCLPITLTFVARVFTGEGTKDVMLQLINSGSEKTESGFNSLS
jgi:hypothetical protein